MKTPAANLSFQAFQVYPEWVLNNLDITALCPAAEGCFWRLMILQWRAITLPADPKQIQRLTKVHSEKEWKAIWPEIEPLFPLIEDGTGRRNPEQYALYLERVAFIEQKRTNGKSGGRPPKQPESKKQPAKKRTQSAAKPDGEPTGKRRETKQKPSGFDPPNQSETPMSLSVSGTVTGALPETSNPPSTSSSSSEGITLVDSTSVAHCVRLAAAANLGLTEALGGNQERVVASSGWELVRDCDEAGVPLEFAADTVYAAARTARKPIGGLWYFRRRVVEAWQKSQDQEQAKAGLSSYTPPAARIEKGAEMRSAMRSAREGDPDAIAYCQEHHLDYLQEAVA